MTKWANPTGRRRVHPAWYSILAGIGIVVLLVVTCQGCAAKVVDLSDAFREIQAKNVALIQKNESLSKEIKTVAGDNARITTISLTSVGGYGWGGLATLLGIVVWRQKRTREEAAQRMINKLKCDGNCTVKVVRGWIKTEGRSRGVQDAAERWINKQVKRL